MSRTLYRLQRQAQAEAVQMFLGANNLNIRDTDGVQRWFAPIKLRVEQLDLAKLNQFYRDVSDEFHEAVARFAEAPHVLPFPTLEPPSNDNKFVYSKDLVAKIHSLCPDESIEMLSSKVHVILHRFSEEHPNCRRKTKRIGKNGQTWLYDERMTLTHLQEHFSKVD